MFMMKNKLWYLQVVRKMRFSFATALIVGVLGNIPGKVMAQQLKFSLKKEQATIESIIQEIERQSKYTFFYSDNQVRLHKKVSIDVENASIEKILDNILNDTEYKYRIVDNQVIISLSDTFKENSRKTLQKEVKQWISGKVTDATGEPVIGASVVEKGTSNGTVTDLQGEFVLFVDNNTVSIEVSYIGYRQQIVKTETGKFLNILLIEDAKALEEVVVIGYGSQKKVNVIGSISTVDSKKLESRSVPSISNMLTGQLSGVTIKQSSGNPGADEGTIRVRGVGSFGATPSPLVLIDGLPGSLNDLNPVDIESISVLKDASSAAIYGSRAANGVILVKTKGGQKGKANVSYNGYIGFNKASALPDMCDSWEYAELYNKAIGKESFSQDEIRKLKEGTDPYNYPNEHYLDMLLDNKGLQTGHELTVSGGNEKTQYMLSFGYVRQNGLMEHNYYERYNGRVNLTTELVKNIKLTARLGGIASKRYEPSTPGALDNAGFKSFTSNALRFPGLWATKLENGTYGQGPKLQGTPLSWLESGSFYNENADKFTTNIELAYTPLKSLILKAIGGYNYTNGQVRHYRSEMEITSGKKLGPSSLYDNMRKTTYKTFQAIAEYNNSFHKHNFSVLGGYTWEDESNRYVGGMRNNFPSDEVPYLDAGGADGQTNEGNGYDWAIMSFFGRFTYNYDQRYLFESTVRYDGSSRFPSDSKFGLFPSVALGWRLSEETFFKESESLNFINNLKLKASYGTLGNNNIGNYPYQSTYTLNKSMNYIFGGVYTQGAAVTTYVDPRLKWEKTRTADIGFETSLWDNKLTFSSIYFYRKTSDILYKPSASYSAIFGLSVSEVNTGTLENKGLEFELGHQNSVRGVNYHINANFSIIKNKVISLGVGNVEQPNGMVGNGSNLFIGYPMEMYYGYKTDGVFLSDDEVSKWSNQSKIAPNAKAGDLRYLDLHGNDGAVTEADKTYLGSRIPKYTFGLSLGAEYKGFDFNMLLQGVAKVKGLLTNYAGYAFFQEGSIQKWQARETWTNNQESRYPKYPRLEVMSNAGSINTLTSDFWILDASYLKIRNVQLGYTLPSQVTRKFACSNLRLYISLDNPVSFSKYRKGWDPEINTSGDYYPILSTYSFGLTLKF
ncbi:TonB-dependent receptor plug domain protein [Bacteroides pyogenes F0041]|uniref:TonB-dependent receptor plug domain protein n=2 Tax=Bacteroides pyogenes TaxID=310300 RepID=U2E3K8_9BACE|nr:TonB-dependent receptor plug domain protein [Bacteroides pyogenes F0041]GAE21800.1 TonB-dependent receptor [Bacteroides pyogenes JCM 10003]